MVVQRASEMNGLCPMKHDRLEVKATNWFVRLYLLFTLRWRTIERSKRGMKQMFGFDCAFITYIYRCDTSFVVYRSDFEGYLQPSRFADFRDLHSNIASQWILEMPEEAWCSSVGWSLGDTKPFQIQAASFGTSTISPSAMRNINTRQIKARALDEWPTSSSKRMCTIHCLDLYLPRHAFSWGKRRRQHA